MHKSGRASKNHRAWRRWSFCWSSSVWLQFTTSQNWGNLTDVCCEFRPASEQGEPLLSAHHSWKCLRLGVLHFQHISAASGREKIASVTKAVLKTSLKCCVLHPWSSHYFSVGHHSPVGSGPCSLVHMVQNNINHNPFQQNYPCLCWKPVNVALKRNIRALPEYSQNNCPWVQGTHKI